MDFEIPSELGSLQTKVRQFVEGAQKLPARITGGIADTLRPALSNVLNIIPNEIWFLLGLAVAIYILTLLTPKAVSQ